MSLRIQKVKNGIQFAVTILPRSNKNEITGIYNDTLKIRLTAPPIEGKANHSCIRLLAKFFKVKISQVSIVKGSSSRNKVIQIYSSDMGALIKTLRSTLTSYA